MSRDDEDSSQDDDSPEGGESGSERSDLERARRGFAGSWAHARPRLDDPMSWSLPLGRTFGIGIRIHILFLVVVAVQLGRSVMPASDGTQVRLALAYTAIGLGALFVVVLLHEFGHCIACRWWGGLADEILMWPLGGLAFCQPPRDWRAHLWTAAGGPLVNVAIIAVTMPLLGFLSGHWRGVAIPRPWTVADIHLVSDSWFLATLYLVNWVAVLLLLFNLLPLFPLDGGRLLQASLWPRLGYARSMRVAARAGLIGAIVLGVIGLWQSTLSLILIAVFGGLTSFQTIKQLDFTEEMMGFEDSEGGVFATLGEDEEEERSAGDADRRRREEEERRRGEDAARRAKDEAEFDRILDKIREQGIGSLSASERRVLERETERRRRAGG